MDYPRGYPWGIAIHGLPSRLPLGYGNQTYCLSILWDTNPPTVVYIGFAGGSNHTTKDKKNAVCYENVVLHACINFVQQLLSKSLLDVVGGWPLHGTATLSYMIFIFSSNICANQNFFPSLPLLNNNQPI